MTASVREDAPHDPEVIEGLAIFHGLQLCLNLGIYNLLVEFNCQLVVTAIQDQEASSSFGDNIIQDIKDFMARFHSISIFFSH